MKRFIRRDSTRNDVNGEYSEMTPYRFVRQREPRVQDFYPDERFRKLTNKTFIVRPISKMPTVHDAPDPPRATAHPVTDDVLMATTTALHESNL